MSKAGEGWEGTGTGCCDGMFVLPAGQLLSSGLALLRTGSEPYHPEAGSRNTEPESQESLSSWLFHSCFIHQTIPGITSVPGAGMQVREQQTDLTSTAGRDGRDASDVL